MPQVATQEIFEPNDNPLAVITQKNVTQFFAEKGLEPIIEKLRREVDAFQGDISTPEGRKAIASFAHKIAKMKTGTDKLGKDLVSGIKAQAKIIDIERGRAWDEMQALQDKVRKPLTDWEERDERRIADHKSILDQISATQSMPLNITVEEAQKRLDYVNLQAGRNWEEFTDLAQKMIDDCMKALKDKLEALKKVEADARELKRLQDAEASRLKKEHEDNLQKEAADKARREAEEKAAHEKHELERKAKEDADRAEREKKEAAEKAQAEIDKANREKADSDRRAKEAEEARLAQEKKSEEDRKAAEADAKRREEEAAQRERDRQAEQKRNEDAAAKKREQDKAHRAKINNEALAAISTVVDAPGIARAVVEMIAKGGVPHVKISY